MCLITRTEGRNNARENKTTKGKKTKVDIPKRKTKKKETILNKRKKRKRKKKPIADRKKYEKKQAIWTGGEEGREISRHENVKGVGWSQTME